ncbi:MAG: TraC family protein [Candidatus Nitrospinota bacterium M3_3B_026]
MSFHDAIFGSDGGARRSDIDWMARRSPFSDYLPWTAWDPETSVYVNQDDTVGLAWEIQPAAFLGDKAQNALEGLLKHDYPDDSVMQLILVADPDIGGHISRARATRVRDLPLVRRSTEEFEKFLLAGTRRGPAGGAPLRNYRAIVTWKAAASATTPGQVENLRLELTHSLQSAGLDPAPLAPQGLLETMRRLLNSGPWTRGGEYDEKVPLRKQVIKAGEPVRIGWDEVEAGGRRWRLVTPKMFPRQVSPMQTNELFGGFAGASDDSSQIGAPFVYCLTVVFRSLNARIHTRCNLILQQKGVGSFAPSLARKQEEHVWATDALDQGKQFLQVSPMMWVIGETGEQARDAQKRVRRVWEGKGYETQEDKGILSLLFLASLPFGLYGGGKTLEDLERDFITPHDSASAILPVQGDIRGFGEPVVTFCGRKGQVAGLDMFNRRAENHNAFITASTGAGKSFLLNYIASSHYAAGAKIRIIDIGGSYRKMTKMFDARYLDFSGSGGECLNPFTMVRDPAADLPVTAAVIASMVYSSSGQSPSETEYSLLKDACRWAYTERGPEAGVDAVREFLSSFPRHAEEKDAEAAPALAPRAHEMAYNLKDFCSGGAYGKYFNGPATFDIAKDDFVVLELEHVKPIKELFNVVTLQVINAVTQDMYLSDRSTPKLVIFDEAHMFLSEGESEILKKVIEEGYRRARKYYGSFTVITQSIMDLAGFGPVGRVIRSNSAFRFYLESDDYPTAAQEGWIDASRFKLDLLRGVKSRKGDYSEMFMETPGASGVVRLIVDPFSYYVYTSSAPEIAAVEQLVDEGMTYEQAIDELLRRKGEKK